ncbi:hypothetical protein [Sinomonas sp. P47F7]|uniref:hypothetical protein n=1 Tax=Sinomonas sp. P47F7 TaxID=3410987 RepID=UPI003BF56F95
MRWEALFDDFEAQLVEAQRAELEAEVRELAWAEQSELALAERLRGGDGAVIDVALCGGLRFRGEVRQVADTWFCLEAGPRSILIPLHAVVAIGGLGRRSRREVSAVRRGLSFTSALRALARARAQVVCHLGGGSGAPITVSGTIDGVGRDYAELAPSRADAWEARVPGTTLAALSALVAVVSPA